MGKERQTYISIGKLGRSIGRDGELRASIEEAFRNQFGKINHVFLELEGQKVPYFIEYFYDEGDFILKFDDIVNPEMTAHLVNANINLSIDQVEKLNITKKQIKGSFEQFKILTEEHQFIGTIIKIEEYPHQIMSFVELSDGKVVMIPLIEDWILDVDLKNKSISMDLPKGLTGLDEEE